MNEAQFGARVARALDTSTDRLSYRVSQKLAASREAAAGRAPFATASAITVIGAPPSRMGGAVAQMGGIGDGGGNVPRLWRLSAALLPLLIVLAGLVSISYWDDDIKAEELADVDTAVLTDDVPLETLTDRGFGVFVTNSRQQR